MAHLIEKNLQASDFCLKVEKNYKDYLIGEHELFDRFVSGVFATSGEDLLGESIDLEGLKTFIIHQKTKPMYVNQMHDLTVAPIGRILASGLFEDPDSKIHFIAGVIGLYSPDFYQPSLPKISPSNPSLNSVTDGHKFSLLIDDYDLTPGAQIPFDQAPDLIDRNSKRLVNKGLDGGDSVQILLLSGTIGAVGLLAAGFFGEAGKDLYIWIKEKVLPSFKKTTNKRALGIVFPYKSAQIEAYINVLNDHDYDRAFSELGNCLHDITSRVENSMANPITRLVIQFNSEHKIWQISFIIHKNGLILSSEIPSKVDLDKFSGISVGATANRDQKQ